MNQVRKALKPSVLGTEILDVGCGSFPLWLHRAPFSRKVGVDQLAAIGVDGSGPAPGGIEVRKLSLDGKERLPFPDGSFSCVTSLAVIEHLEPSALPALMAEMHRVLKPSGQLLLTTPHALADGLLRLLAKAGLVSAEEIEDHKSLFFHGHIRSLLRHGGFPGEKIQVGGFLLGLNILAVAEK
jgi:SAM-dependent methyltransferase